MATLTGNTFSGFTRPSDPIVAGDLATKISTAISKTVTVVVTPTDIQVTGATLVSGDGTAIQVAMTAYFYPGLEYGVGLYADDDGSMTANSGVRVPTQAAVVTAMKNSRFAWMSGVKKPGSFVYYSKTTTASGTVTFYITDDGTSSGNAVFTSVYLDSITISPYGSGAVYQVSAPTISGDNKSITATINQVTSVILGLIQISSAANGVDCRMLVLGS